MSCSFEKCGRLWKAVWLHNVDNIQQKDIKNKLSGLSWGLFFSIVWYGSGSSPNFYLDPDPGNWFWSGGSWSAGSWSVTVPARLNPCCCCCRCVRVRTISGTWAAWTRPPRSASTLAPPRHNNSQVTLLPTVPCLNTIQIWNNTTGEIWTSCLYLNFFLPCASGTSYGTNPEIRFAFGDYSLCSSDQGFGAGVSSWSRHFSPALFPFPEDLNLT